MRTPPREFLPWDRLRLLALLWAATATGPAIGQESVIRDDVNFVAGEQTRSGPSLEVVARVTDLSETVTALAYHPNGRTLAAGGRDGGLWLFQTQERGGLSVWSRLEPDGRGILDIAFSKDGSVLAAAKEDGRVLIRRFGLQDETIHSPGETPISSIALSPDGSVLAVARRDIELWHTGQLRRQAILRGHGAPVRELYFRPRGRKLFSVGEDSAVRLWLVEEGKLYAARPSSEGVVPCITIGPKGLFFVAGGCANETVRVENLAVGTVRYAFPAGGCVESVGFSHDGRLAIAAVSRGGTPELVLWSLSDGSPLLREPGRDFQLMSISSQGEFIAGSAGDGVELVRIVYPE